MAIFYKRLPCGGLNAEWRATLSQREYNNNFPVTRDPRVGKRHKLVNYMNKDGPYVQ